MSENTNLELLAPAGCYPSLQAALNNGADSIYFGLAQLNMRARARRSFVGADLPDIMDRIHKAGRKGYLTINTILYDHDLPLANSLLEEAKRCNVDGVIVSDIAGMEAAFELGLEIHISTQLSISNYPSLKFFARWADRVVLARELTLGAIKRIHKEIVSNDLRGPSGRPMEIEAFAHGALCVAVSGRCDMSLYTSNASANRGACEQNCRREYTVTDTQTGKQLVVDNNYIMSPNDLCTIEFIDRMVDAGITTFKLEGRARAPEYVDAVVGAYRQAIDAVKADAFTPELVESLMPGLHKVYNRGFSSGFYFGREGGWSAAPGSKATHRKVLVGPVKNYFAKAGVVVVKITDSKVTAGDDYLLVGPTTGVVKGTLENLRIDGESTDTALQGSLVSFQVPERIRLSDRMFIMVPVANA